MTNAVLSFEFFPPNSKAGEDKLMAVAQQLDNFKPDFYSVTFGAGGSAQHRTRDVVTELQGRVRADVAAHVSCVGMTEDKLMAMLSGYLKANVRRLVVLRGDVSAEGLSFGEFRYASDLVSWIRSAFGDVFDISVACYPESHPESNHAGDDFNHFIRKARLGANRAITQYFYNIEAYECFMERVRHAGCDIPIVPGIMPVHNLQSLRRFSQRCGAEVPRWMLKDLLAYSADPSALQARGIELLTRLCDRLLNAGAPGLHFYTLNKFEVTEAIVNNCRSLGHEFACAHEAAAVPL